MRPNPDLSICIVTYKARDLLRDCLRSLCEQPPGPSLEILVVDNGSDDGTLEMLRGEFPEVRLILNPGNLGYTLPMNQALRAAGGRYLVQLNPDTKVVGGALKALFEYLEANPRVGIATPKVLNRDGSLQKQCRRSAARPWDTFTYFTGLSRLFPRSRLFARYLMTYLNEDEINEVEAVSGSCMFIRRAVIENIGYLDERYFAYQEDADFCFRARQAGWRIEYLPFARVIHYGGQGGTRVEVYRSIYEWHRSYFTYYRTHLARSYFFLVNWAMYAAIGLKLALNLVTTFFRRDKFAGTRKP